MTGTPRPITVVVPVFGDLPSLMRCVNALLATVNVDDGAGADRVLLVNDCGPQADEIEAALLTAIEGREDFRYERNPRNLGFVGTCNRAALELSDPGSDLLLLNSDAEPTPGWLDELRAVLHESPQNGIVCPRSDNATIASLPFRRRHPGAPRTRERTLALHEALRAELPRSSVMPVAMGFCFLVRRELVDRFGLFDPAFAPGYGEENDFCLRMARKGFRSLIAHRALVYHAGARSFTAADRKRLRASHELLLMRRHPDYHDRVQRYLRQEADPVDVFADALIPADEVRRVIVDVGDRPAPGLLAALAAHTTDEIALTVRSTGRTPAVTGHETVGRDPGPRIWDVAIAAPGAEHRRDIVLLAPRFVPLVDDDVAHALELAAATARREVTPAELRTRWASATPERARGRRREHLRTRLRLELDARPGTRELLRRVLRRLRLRIGA